MLGIDAFEGIANATVTLALDASATVAVNGSAHLPGKGSDSGFELADGACVDVSTALNVNAAADAGLFDIFSNSLVHDGRGPRYLWPFSIHSCQPERMEFWGVR